MKKFKITSIIFCLAVITLSIFMCSCKKDDSPLGIKEKLTQYNISINLNLEDFTLDCKQKMSVYNNNGEDLTNLKFHLYPKAFTMGAIYPSVNSLYTAKAYPNGKSYGDITINKCYNDENNIDFYCEGSDNDILVVNINSSSEEYVDFYIEYEVKLPNINHRFGYGENTINLANFYPILCVYENGEFSTKPYSTNGDPFYSNIANYEVDITYPSNYILAHSGNLIKNEDNALNTTAYIKGENIRDFAMTLSSKFKVLTHNINGDKGIIAINYYYYSDEYPEKSLQTCVDSLSTFNELFCCYPYKQLSVCETNFVYGGMEYPNLVFISDDISAYSDYTNTIIHEIAHQWWYGIVGNDEYTYGWLDEGLTEYSTALFYEKNPSYEVTMKDIITNTTNSYLLFVQVYTDVFGNCNTTMSRLLNEYDTEPEYVYIAYVKAVLLFNDIRELIGNENFINGLKLYIKEYKGKNATPDNLIECMEKTSSKPLKDIFYSYIDGKVIIIPNE